MKYFFLIILLSAFGFIFYKGLNTDPTLIPSNLISQKTPSFKLQKLKKYKLLKSEDLDKKHFKIVNFFATWCAPCKVEHPQLMKLSESFIVHGIAKKDKEKDIQNWLKNYGNPFNKLGLDNDGSTSIQWGVYGLPETFLINENGEIIYKHIGPIMKKDLEKLISILK